MAVGTRVSKVLAQVVICGELVYVGEKGGPELLADACSRGLS
jgi:hypothetical protein